MLERDTMWENDCKENIFNKIKGRKRRGKSKQFLHRNEGYSEKYWCGRILYTKSVKDTLCYGLVEGIRTSHNSAHMYVYCTHKTYYVWNMLEDI